MWLSRRIVPLISTGVSVDLVVNKNYVNVKENEKWLKKTQRYFSSLQ